MQSSPAPGHECYLSEWEQSRRGQPSHMRLICEEGRDQGRYPGNLRGFTCLKHCWYPAAGAPVASWLFVNRN